MSGWLRRMLVLSVVVTMCGVTWVNAAGPGGHSIGKKKKSWFSKTVTTTVLKGQLQIYDGATPDSSGYAEYKVVTVVCKGPCYSSTTTNRYLTATFANVEEEVNEQLATYRFSTQIPYEPQPTELVVNGAATLKLSTPQGDDVPFIQKGDVINSDTPMCAPFVAWFFDTDPVTTVTTFGR